MAEKALYENSNEPCFPFELIRARLAWLPAYLSANLNYDLDPLLNTVLVFARARTATLQDMRMWNMVQSFVKCLNAAADSVGASYH